MTEQSSMLPVAKFQCQKLVLVGDPKVKKNHLFKVITFNSNTPYKVLVVSACYALN